MAYEATEVPVSRSQEGLRKLILAHKGFGLAVVSERDPDGKEPSQEGFEAKVMIEGVAYVVRIRAKVKSAGRYLTDRQKQIFREQEERRIWRVLYYHMKGIFEAADTGVMEFREMMLPYIVMPDGHTVADYIVPRLASAIAGDPSRLLPERTGM